MTASPVHPEIEKLAREMFGDESWDDLLDRDKKWWHDLATTAHRHILSEPPSSEMVEAGSAEMATLPHPHNAARAAARIWPAMNRARLVELGLEGDQ